MSSERHRQITELFAACVALEPSARATFLERECGEDHELRAEVEALLQSHAEDSFLERPDLATPTFGASDAGGSDDAIPDAEPAQIGPYRILSTLGEGGMGTVYLAQQEEPVRRQVALKVIKLGMDSKQILSRFKLERQALAVMSHPSIAGVHDAGTTEQGQPYFVMELVEGTPLTDYCDQNRLSVKERLQLFQQICFGVQHAHQKGILHRDLKPSNILVSRKDERHVVKIIDFGLARATDQTLEHSFLSVQGVPMGTPDYMSPEQADGSADIDTRTDIYSLGVVLYELLTGELPFASASVRGVGLLEIQRVIREVEPKRPSTRISSIGEQASESARRRGLSLSALHKTLRGDLDWIVMRAMAKEPDRRYESATSLAQDLARHLAHEPVEAGPPSTVYRVSKMVRKYRTQVAAAGLVFLALMAGIVTSWRYYLSAQSEAELKDKQRKIAVRNAKDARQQAEIAKKEREKAQAKADEIQAVIDFIDRDLFGSINPDQAHDVDLKDLKVRDVLDRAAERIGTRFGEHPGVEARLRQIIGWTYEQLGYHEEAIPHLQRSEALCKTVYGTSSEPRAEALYRLGFAHARIGDAALARKLISESLGILRPLVAEDDPRLQLMSADLEMCKAIEGGAVGMGLGNSLVLTLIAAVRGKKESVEQCRESLQRSLLQVTRLWHGGKKAAAYDVARALAKPFLASFLYRGRVHWTLSAYAVLANQKGLHKQAEAVADCAIHLARTKQLRDNPKTPLVYFNLGRILTEQKRYEEALAPLRESLAANVRILGETHPDTLSGCQCLAEVHAELEQFEAADSLLRRKRAGLEKRRGPAHAKTLEAHFWVGENLLKASAFVRAEKVFREVLDEHTTSVAKSPLLHGVLLWGRGTALYRMDRRAEARVALLEAQGLVKGHEGENRSWSKRIEAALEALDAVKKGDRSGR